MRAKSSCLHWLVSYRTLAHRDGAHRLIGAANGTPHVLFFHRSSDTP